MTLKKSLIFLTPLLAIVLLWLLLSGMDRQREKQREELDLQWEEVLEERDFIEAESLLIQMQEIGGWTEEQLEQRSRLLQFQKEQDQLSKAFKHRLRPVPAGSFDMGSEWNVNLEMNDEAPVHRVKLSGFLMLESEFTLGDAWSLLNLYPHLWKIEEGYLKSREQGQVLLDLDDRNSPWLVEENKLSLKEDQLDFPLAEVTWEGAAFFCNLMSMILDRPIAYNWSSMELESSTGVRLPTEAEWEWAARGAYSNHYPYPGNQDLSELAWYYKDHSSQVHRVMELEPNALGLYDMAGNLYEWCQDWYDFSYYEYSALENPMGPDTGRDKVIRGGSFTDDPFSLRVSFRFFRSPRAEQSYLGFRPLIPLAE